MAYIYIETSVPTHPKFLKCGAAASWLYVCGLIHCQSGLTDGFIPAEALHYLGVKRARKMAARLVLVGLWETVPGGWQVHDYLCHNRSAATIEAIKQAKRKAGAAGGRASGHVRREAHSKQSASVQSKQSADDVLQHNRSKPEALGEPGTVRNGTVRNGTEEKNVSFAPSNGSKPTEAQCFVLEFNTVGRGAKTWGLTAEQLESWRAAYPGVDVEGECRKALAWTEANTRKTAIGMPRFLVSWLNRAVDRGGRNGFAPSPQTSKALPKWALEAQARKANGQ